MQKRRKPYQEMNAKELAEATGEFDREFIADTFRPMTPAERAQWEPARRKPGRPRAGKGLRVISVCIEKNLLDRSDRLARRLDITRDELISRSLRAILVAFGME